MVFLKHSASQEIAKGIIQTDSLVIYIACLATDPWPLSKPILHRERSSDSSFNFQQLLALVCQPVAAYVSSLVFPSSYLYFSKCFRMRFLRQKRPIYLPFLLIILCRVLLSGGRDNAVDIATRYGMGGPGIESRWGRHFPHPSRTFLGPTPPPIQ